MGNQSHLTDEFKHSCDVGAIITVSFELLTSRGIADGTQADIDEQHAKKEMTLII